MTTGSTIVTDALFACGAYGQGDSLANADQDLVLRRLNRMLDSWTNERGMIYEVVYYTFATVAGTQNYTSTAWYGAGPVPVVDSMFAVLSNVVYPIKLIGNQEWDAIPYLLTRSVPRNCYIERAATLSTFKFYPIPDQVYTINVGLMKALPDTITGGTTISLPLGYEKAIIDNLAVDIAPSFGQQVTPQMMLAAKQSRAVIRRTNAVPLELDLPWVAPQRSNIITGP